MKSGLSQEEATVQFQELLHAYKVLSDPKERAWKGLHFWQSTFKVNGQHPIDASGTNIAQIYKKGGPNLWIKLSGD